MRLAAPSPERQARLARPLGASESRSAHPASSADPLQRARLEFEMRELFSGEGSDLTTIPHPAPSADDSRRSGRTRPRGGGGDACGCAGQGPRPVTASWERCRSPSVGRPCYRRTAAPGRPCSQSRRSTPGYRVNAATRGRPERLDQPVGSRAARGQPRPHEGTRRRNWQSGET